MQKEEIKKPVLISSAELCEQVPMSDNSLRKYLENPKFPRYKVHSDFKFKLDEVIQFLKVNK